MKRKPSYTNRSLLLDDAIKVTSINTNFPRPSLASNSYTTLRNFHEFRNLYADKLNNIYEDDEPPKRKVSFAETAQRKTEITPNIITIDMPKLGTDRAIVVPKHIITPIFREPPTRPPTVEKPKNTLEKLVEMEENVETTNFLDENYMDIAIAQKQLEEISKLISNKSSSESAPSTDTVSSNTMVGKPPLWNPKTKAKPKNVDRKKKVMETLNELNDRLKQIQDKYFSGTHIMYKSVDETLADIEKSQTIEDAIDAKVSDHKILENFDMDEEAKLFHKLTLENNDTLEKKIIAVPEDIDIEALQSKFENLQKMQKELLGRNQVIKKEFEDESRNKLTFGPKDVGDVEKFFDKFCNIFNSDDKPEAVFDDTKLEITEIHAAPNKLPSGDTFSVVDSCPSLDSNYGVLKIDHELQTKASLERFETIIECKTPETDKVTQLAQILSVDKNIDIKLSEDLLSICRKEKSTSIQNLKDRSTGTTRHIRSEKTRSKFGSKHVEDLVKQSNFLSREFDVDGDKKHRKMPPVK